MANRIFRAFGAVDDTSGTGLVYINCEHLDNKNFTFDFQFGGNDGPIIQVPIDEMVLDNVKQYIELGLDVPSLPFDNVCSFGLQGSSDYYLLGDTFLRSAYVVYDLTNKKIGLAQANLNSTESKIVEITKSGIPDASGVASQVIATQTAGSGNSSSGTSSDTPGSETSEGASSRVVPAPSWEVLVMVSMASLSGLMGAGLVML